MSSVSLLPLKSSPFSHEVLFLLLLDWLDIRTLRIFDAAITHNDSGGGGGSGGVIPNTDCMISNENTKSIWLQCLKTAINLKALVTMEYDHSWIRWIIDRGVKTSKILVKQASVREITDATFKNIKMSTLRSINLSNCKEVTDATIKGLSIGCPNITSINISNCRKTTNASMVILKDQFMDLSEVDIENCKGITDAGVSELLKCTSLKSLRLAYNSHLTENAFMDLGSACQGIRIIDLEECTRLKDDGVLNLCKACPLLESININSCRSLTTISLEGIAKCKHLTTAKLQNRSDIKDNHIIDIVEGCPQLQVLHLLDCYQITDVTLNAIGRSQRNLTDLSFSITGRSVMTDAGVRAMMYGCPYLQHLVIFSCGYLTDEIMGPLGLSCPDLKYLDISKCEKLTATGVSNLLQTCPSIQCIKFNWCSPSTFIGLFSLQMEHPRISFVYRAHTSD